MHIVDPPCLDLGIIQELGNFLDWQDDAKLQKRKWQHLNWTYNVWFPLHKEGVQAGVQVQIYEGVSTG